MMLHCTIAGAGARPPERVVSFIARTVVRGLASAPHFANRLGRALNRSVAGRYEEQRVRFERTGSGGLL